MPRNFFFDIDPNEVHQNQNLINPKLRHKDLVANSGPYTVDWKLVKDDVDVCSNGIIEYQQMQNELYGDYTPFKGIWGEIFFSCAKSRSFRGKDSVKKCPSMANLEESPDNSGWIAGHLLNAKLGGDDNIENFAPISANLNKIHSSQCESIMQRIFEFPSAFFKTPEDIKVVYRTHVIAPRIGKRYPEGLCVSLGFISKDKKGKNILNSPQITIDMLQRLYENNRENHEDDTTNIFAYGLKRTPNVIKRIELMVRGHILAYGE